MKKIRCNRCVFGMKVMWPFVWCEIRGRFRFRCGRCIYRAARRKEERL